MTMTATTTKERPILLKPHEVRGILDGRQTQLRRKVRAKQIFAAGTCKKCKAWKLLCGCANVSAFSPYGKRGDVLWCKETWRTHERESDMVDGILFAADDAFVPIENTHVAADDWVVAHRRDKRWRSPSHMPAWASRLSLRITDVRVERLNSISEEDAIAEGADRLSSPSEQAAEIDLRDSGYFTPEWGYTHVEGYRQLWESINGEGSWKLNPWTWCVSFERVSP